MALDHKGKIALVTVANKGIGLEVARQLGAQDVTVFLGARNPHLGKAARTFRALCVTPRLRQRLMSTRSRWSRRYAWRST